MPIFIGGGSVEPNLNFFDNKSGAIPNKSATMQENSHYAPISGGNLQQYQTWSLVDYRVFDRKWG